jgi:hypothetical protein
MEAEYSFEAVVDICPITQHYIPEGSTLLRHRCENLKSSIPCIFFIYYLIWRDICNQCSIANKCTPVFGHGEIVLAFDLLWDSHCPLQKHYFF